MMISQGSAASLFIVGMSHRPAVATSMMFPAVAREPASRFETSTSTTRPVLGPGPSIWVIRSGSTEYFCRTGQAMTAPWRRVPEKRASISSKHSSARRYATQSPPSSERCRNTAS